MDKIRKLKDKKIIAAAVAVVAVIVCIFVFRQDSADNTDKIIISNGTRTTVLRPTTLADSVTVTGTVESTESVNVTTTVENTKVREILVQAGDRVTEGDILIKLDTGTILEKIEEAREKLEESAEKAQKEYTEAEDALADALEDAEEAE
ncbi:MAG: biotin/lipoyl-binding protein, partial [Oscillospiraceae bacterium]|nr:biotin/lipoyl-binding protein [Oscillospiraceae bacterium]